MAEVIAPWEFMQKSTWDTPNLAKPAKVGKNVLDALAGYLPGYQELLAKLSPAEADIESKLFSKYLPQYSKTGTEVMGQEQQGNINNDISAILGGGADAVRGASFLERLASPEYTRSMQTANQGFQDLIGGMDPNKLSGSEMANVERGVNRVAARTGNLNTGDATSTTSAAMQFGGALDTKRQNFANALNLFPGLATASKSGVDTYNVGTGKASGPNIGTQFFNPSTGTQGLTQAQNQFFGASGVQQSGLAQQKSPGEKFGAGVGGVCCFIMMEAYGFFKVPASVRMARDFYYKQSPQTAKGYRKMASWLVPLMQKSKIIRKLVEYSMVKPLTAYSEYLTGTSSWKRIFKPAKLWLSIWNLYGSR